MVSWSAFKHLVLLPHFEDEEQNRTASVLYVFAVASLAVLCLVLISRLIAREASQVLPVELAIAITMISIILTRRGMLKWSGSLMLWSLIALLEYQMWRYDGIRDTAVIAFPGVLVVAGLVLSRREFFAMAISAILSVIVIGILELEGVTQKILRATITSLDLVDLVVIISITAVAIRLLADELLRSLARARNGERENRRQGDQLRESELRYRTLFEGANDAAFLIRGELIIECNEMAIRMLGRSHRSEIVGHAPWEFSPPQQPDGRNSEAKAVELIGLAMSGSPQKFDWKHRRKDQMDIETEVSLNRFDSGTGILVQALVTDVTERKRTEDSLRESNMRFKLIAETITEVFWMADTELDRMFYVSPGYEQVWGRTCESLLTDPRSFLEAVHRDDLQRILQDYENKKLGRPFDHEYRIIRPDGSIKWIWDRGYPVINKQGQVAQYVGVAQDVTVRKEKEHQMAMLAEAVKGVNECISITDRNNKLLFVNDAFLNNYNFDRNEVLGRDISIIHVERHPSEAIQEIYRLTREGGWSGELLNRRKDGSIFPIHLSLSRIKDRDGEVVAQIAIANDITERKCAEESIRESEERYRSTIDGMSDAVHVVDSTFRVVLINEAFKRWNRELGLNTDAVGRPILEVVPFLSDSVLDEYREVFGTGRMVLTEDRSWLGDKEIYTETRKIPLLEGGRVCNVLTVIHDVTAREKTESEIRQTLEWQQAIFEGSRDAIFISDTESRFVAVNRAACDLTGYSRSELLGMCSGDLHDQPDLSASQVSHKKVLDGEEILREAKILRKNGSKIDAEFNITRITIAGNPFIHSAARDISVRKRAEQSLRESESKFRTFADESPNMIFINREGRIVYANAQCERKLGYALGELLGPDFSFWNLIAPESIPVVRESYTYHLGGEEYEPYEYVLVSREGRKLDVIINSKLIPYEGSHAILGMVTDITEQKQAALAVEREHALLQTLIENIPDEVCLKDIQHRYVMANAACIEALGATSLEQMIGKTDEDYVRPDLLQAHLAEEERVLMSREPMINRERVRIDATTGKIAKCDLSTKVPVVEKSGKVIGLLVVNRNITDRKIAEEAMRSSEERYRAMYEGNPSMYFTIDARGVVLAVNRCGAEELGYSAGELIGQPIVTIFHEDDKAAVLHQFAMCLQNPNQVAHWVYRKVRKDGSVLWVREAARAVTGMNGSPAIFVVCEDITELKQIEAALKKSEELYRTTFENTGLPSVLIEENTIICLANAEFERLTGYSRSEIEGKKCWTEFVVKEDLDRMLAQHRLRRENAQQALKNYEFRLLTRAGDVRNIYLTIDLIPGTKKSVASLLDFTERNLIEQELIGRTSELKSIFRALPDLYFRLASDGTILDYEAGAASDFYVDPGEFLGKQVQYVLPASVGPDCENAIRKTLSGKELVAFEYALRLPNGEKSFEARFVPLQGDQVIAIVRDITLRKKVEESLRESEGKFRSIIEQSVDGIVLTDECGLVLEWNNAQEVITGLKREGVVGAPVWNVLLQAFPKRMRTEELAEKLRAKTHAFLKTGRGPRASRVTESEIERDDGTRRSVQTVMFPIKTILGYMAGSISRDITEQKHAEEALLASEKQYRNLFESANDAIFIFEPLNEIVLEANSRACELYGFSREEFVGLSLKAVTQNIDQGEQAIRWTLNTGNLKDFETTHFRKNGTAIHVLINASFIDYKGERAILSIARDVTERNRVRDERQKLEMQLVQTQKIESVGTLAAGIAHDFNNILNVIMGSISLLSAHLGDREKSLYRIKRITEATERGAQLVRQLLTFARKTNVERCEIVVNDLIRETAKLLEETFPKTIEVTLRLKPSLPVVISDPNQLHQVLVNLCVNARDAMPHGGRLRIQTGCEAGALIRKKFPGASSEKYVSISITDSGIGMKEETRKRIFDPFFTTKEVGKGTGLGLAVVLGIIQNHSGFIDVESEVNAGTEFRLYLPGQERLVMGRQEVDNKVGSVPGGTETILYVEDEEVVRELVAETLKQKGYKVLTAGDGEEAEKVLQAHLQEISLLLTDLGLPKRDGEELCRRAKSLNPSLPLAIVTGFLDPARKAALAEIGVDDVVDKPCKLEDLLSRVRSILDRERLQ